MIRNQLRDSLTVPALGKRKYLGKRTHTPVNKYILARVSMHVPSSRMGGSYVCVYRCTIGANCVTVTPLLSLLLPSQFLRSDTPASLVLGYAHASRYGRFLCTRCMHANRDYYTSIYSILHIHIYMMKITVANNRKGVTLLINHKTCAFFILSRLWRYICI